MMVDVYDQKKAKVGTVELSDRVFGVAWKPALVHQVLTAYLANRRRPWAHAKTRAEVRGGGRKPWRQKGTGRARHGSIRSPLWRGGGKSHGPSKDRDYSEKINKKMKRQALFSVLSKKLADGELKVIDRFDIREAKTKELALILRMFLAMEKKKKNYDVLLIEGKNVKLRRAVANLPKAAVLPPASLNIYDLLNHKQVILDQGAIPELAARYTGKQSK